MPPEEPERPPHREECRGAGAPASEWQLCPGCVWEEELANRLWAAMDAYRANMEAARRWEGRT